MFNKIEDALLAASGLMGGGGGGGGSATLIEKSVTANATYKASDDNADGYSKVTVNVANSYAAGDEGKVVSDGELVAQTSDTATSNGTVDTTLINSLTVAVPAGTQIQPPYKVSSGSIVPASNTQALHVPLNGITSVATATILVDDYENYATKYIDEAPIFVRANQVRGTPISGGSAASSSVYLKADETLGSSSNSNGAGVSGTDYVFGCFVTSTYFRAGVKYNYVVVGV
jgi:hypothetical protein